MDNLNKHHHTRRIQSFVRRDGRMTAGQRRALQGLWPKYGVSADASPDLDLLFGRTAPRILEIGFGNGEGLADMAVQHPDCDFIGIEIHRPGVGHLLHLLEQRGIDNVRIYNEDAVVVLQNCLPDHSLERLLLFFPDPWHKTRHHKRRIVQPEFIELVASKLAHGGTLHMATDWESYAKHMLAVTGQSTAFRNCAADEKYSQRPGDRPTTRFEQRGQRLGHTVRDLLFRRL